MTTDDLEMAKKAADRRPEWKQDLLQSSGKSTAAPRMNTADDKRTLGCKWWYDDEHDTWNTECDDSMQFIDGGPVENSFIWCPYCGFVILPERES